MDVIGYKCFDKGLINKYGKKFSVGKIYIIPGTIRFGINGFHLCKRIEDTFRYFECFENEIDVCLVKGSGEIIESYDDYYGYYDMYSVQNLEILKRLSREEIINEGLKMCDLRAERFVSTFRLTEEEVNIFKETFKTNLSVLHAIAYYQEGDKQVYERKYKINK